MPAITRDKNQTNEDIQRIKCGGWAIDDIADLRQAVMLKASHVMAEE